MRTRTAPAARTTLRPGLQQVARAWLAAPARPVPTSAHRASLIARPLQALLTEASAASMASAAGPVIPAVDPTTAATLAVQNMVQLCKDLRLPVTYKAQELTTASSADSDTREFRVVVHVHSDYAFKKYLNTCSATDLTLYRGLLLAVKTDSNVKHVKEAYVQQAFLPKFENEGQDHTIADQIVRESDERYMVVTIKHSGSLVTLSGEGFAAKNSVNNEYTAGGVVLLRAHFDRVYGIEHGAARLAEFMALLRERRMAVSFEMVTACHGHHGQLPGAEYLVATAAHIQDTQTGKPRFLGWQEFLTFCLEQKLPVNDTWLFQGRQWAGAARVLLDDLSLSGGITAIALNKLNELVKEGASGGCLHVSGTYPHDEWQGSRLEGFVVAQGQPYSAQLTQALEQLSTTAAKQVLPISSVPSSLQQPYQLVTGFKAAGYDPGRLSRQASQQANNSTAGTSGPADMVSRALSGVLPGGGGGRGGGGGGRGGGRRGGGGGGRGGTPGASRPASAAAGGAASSGANTTSAGRGGRGGGGSGPSSHTASLSGPQSAPPQQVPTQGPSGAQDEWTQVGKGGKGHRGHQHHAQQRGGAPAQAQTAQAAPPTQPPAPQPSAAASAAVSAALAGSGARSARGMNPNAAIFASAVRAATTDAASAGRGGPRPQSASSPAAAAAAAAAGAAGGRPVSAAAPRQHHNQSRGGPRAPPGPPAPPPPPPPSPPAPPAPVASDTSSLRAASAQDTDPPGGAAAGLAAAGESDYGAAVIDKGGMDVITAQQSSWLPKHTLTNADPKIREKLPTLLLAYEAPGPVVRLPSGQLMFIRAAFAQCKPQERQAAISDAVAYLQQHSKSGTVAGLSAPPSAKVVSDVLDTCCKAKADTTTLAAMPKQLLGAPDLGSNLRYKKKMLMWRIAGGNARFARTASDTAARAMSIDAPAAASAAAANGSTDQQPTAAAAAAAATASVSGQDLDRLSGVGYCMMTFIIRNGMQSLSQGQQQYLGYVNHLARGWGLPERAIKEINTFARAWMSWVSQHGGVSAIKGGYLHLAEPFVTHFLDCMARGDVGALLGTRDKDAFQGVVVLLNESDASKAAQLQRALNAGTLIDLTEEERTQSRNKKKNSQCPPFTKTLVQQGTVMFWPGANPQREAVDLLKEAGRSAFCVTVRQDGREDSQNAKRFQGMASSTLKRIEETLSAAHPPNTPAGTYLRTVDPGYRVADIVSWLGRGVPLPPSDPAAICCFISIPGVGKTFLTDGMKTLPDVDNTAITLRALNGDRLKKQNVPPARYWYEVAGAASTNNGSGAVTLVVADKNLVPSPYGNIQRATGILSDSGAVTVAVVPSWRGTPAQDVGVAYPDLPFPLELIALCMLRILQRKNHEGGLDATLPIALRVSTMFALFYKHRSRDDLLDLVRGQFAVVAELPVIDIPTDTDKQVPVKVLRLIAEGLRDFNERERDERKRLPDSWEKELREELNKPDTQQRILGMQVAVDEARLCLGNALLQGLQEAKAIADGDSVSKAALITAGGEESRPPRYIGVGGKDDGRLLETARALLPPNTDLNMYKDGTFHVTLWHSQDPVMGRNHMMRDDLLAAVGTEIEMQILSIDHQDGVATAAQVQLLSAPEAAFVKPYHHITLSIGQGLGAKEANTLPGRIEAGTAQRYEVTEQVTLTGTISGFF